jgi:hypothetical protein
MAQHSHTRSNVMALLRAPLRTRRRHPRLRPNSGLWLEEGGPYDVGARRQIPAAVHVRRRTK